ncbi:MAG: VOC family protein [Hyphomonadaceae bacterium]|nr:VOC family protein [Hyphomonadaceae bacterium]
MKRVVHFEIHADDPAACARWYGALFGWTMQEMPALDYWLINTGEGPGISGGIVRRKGPKPAIGAPVSSFVCTIGTDTLDADFAAALKAGGVEALPKTPIPGVGYIAYVIDPFGNIFGLHQADPNAGRP